MINKTIEELFGDNIHNHSIIEETKEHSIEPMCHIGDLIPIYEFEINQLKEKIKVLKKAENKGVLIPLNEYWAAYNSKTTIDNWFDNFMQNVYTFIYQTKQKKYNIVPCHPKDNCIEELNKTNILKSNQKQIINKIIHFVQELINKKD